MTKTEKSELLKSIRAVLKTGTPWRINALHYPVYQIVNAVLLIKGMKKRPTEDDEEGFVTNGWQWDWWQHFSYNGKSYTLSGSGYYGGHAFYLSD